MFLIAHLSACIQNVSVACRVSNTLQNFERSSPTDSMGIESIQGAVVLGAARHDSYHLLLYLTYQLQTPYSPLYRSWISTSFHSNADPSHHPPRHLGNHINNKNTPYIEEHPIPIFPTPSQKRKHISESTVPTYLPTFLSQNLFVRNIIRNPSFRFWDLI